MFDWVRREAGPHDTAPTGRQPDSSAREDAGELHSVCSILCIACGIGVLMSLHCHLAAEHDGVCAAGAQQSSFIIIKICVSVMMACCLCDDARKRRASAVICSKYSFCDLTAIRDPPINWHTTGHSSENHKKTLHFAISNENPTRNTSLATKAQLRPAPAAINATGHELSKSQSSDRPFNWACRPSRLVACATPSTNTRCRTSSVSHTASIRQTPSGRSDQFKQNIQLNFD